ncbi:4-hydroxythreonine-4-phosphate dehydrogenase [Bacteroidia bacterium]|nr:4-hydroxythreonine-4-phosphate dehydrogenase [Bacteroidia bacterium]
MAEQIKIGITQGDINGVSYEVIIKTLAEARMLEVCVPIVYGSSKVAAFHRKLVGAENFSFNIIRSTSEANPKRANIINVMDDSAMVEIGKPTEMSGKGALAALNAAIKDLKEGKIDALVTAPFNKQNVVSVGYTFPGHTEFLANAFDKKDVLMLLVHNGLRVGVVTGHIALSKVTATLTKDLILKKIKLFHHALQQDFGIHRPRIAVLGLNPHAGDKGLMGNEEAEIIVPALDEAVKNHILAFGPYPADGFFFNQSTQYDGVLAMYHDQGLAPFKVLSMGEGVNFTAGLPIVRTSPAHGTAYDIAGSNTANPSSFRNAIYLACDVVHKRKEYAKLTSNPLELVRQNVMPRGN